MKALRLVKALEGKGLRVFFDYEAMLVHASSDSRAGMNKAMASNIKSSAAVQLWFVASRKLMRKVRTACGSSPTRTSTTRSFTT